MKAMLLTELGSVKSNPTPLSLRTVPDPVPGEGEILIRVSACGVCHTELDEIEGRTSPPELPVILGHQAVGVVEEINERRSDDFNRQLATTPAPAGVAGKVATTVPIQVGDRVGVAWIYSACGECEYCRSGQENLCPYFKATGRDVNGGYAQYMTVPAAFVHPIPESLADSEAAPLLCAGAIGYRSLRLSNIKNGGALGLTGFGGSNHLVLKMAKHLYPDIQIFVFSRNPEEREFARALGAVWAGEIEATSPRKLDAIIDTTPVWKPVVEALRNLDNGGRLVVNAIRKEDLDKDYLLNLDYPSHLWMEKEIKSIANVARQDVREFLKLAAEAGLRPEIQEYALEDANQALLDLRHGKIMGRESVENRVLIGNVGVKMKRVQNPATVHSPLAGYSHQIEIIEAKRWLVLSGQIGMLVDGSLPYDPIEQLRVALDNIYKNLDTAGMEIQDLVKLTIYLVGEFDTDKRRAVLAEWLGGHSPCSTLIYVAALATPDIKVEIDAWACD